MLGHHGGIVGNVDVVANHYLEGLLDWLELDRPFRLAKVGVVVFIGNRLVGGWGGFASISRWSSSAYLG